MAHDPNPDAELDELVAAALDEAVGPDQLADACQAALFDLAPLRPAPYDPGARR